jgi:hypothetical protein
MKWTRAVAINVTLGSAAMVATGAAVLLSASASLTTPTTREVQLALFSAGLSPQTLAAAGFSAAQASTALATVLEEHEAAVLALNAADERLQRAKEARDRTLARIRSGVASQAEATGLQALEAEVAAARSDRAQRVDNIRRPVTEMRPGSAEIIRAITENAVEGIPIWCSVIDRPTEQTIALRDALSAKQIRERLGETVPTEVTAVINATLGNQQVASAKANLEANQETVTAAWATVFAHP